MGSINVLWNPKSWLVLNQGESSICKGELIYQMMIGEGEDHYHYHYSFIEYISKNNYDRIVDGTYKLVRFPDSDIKVLLFDENGKLIPLVNGAKINESLIDETQLEVISNMENEVSLKMKKKEN